jgi:hypothetical protein
MGEEENVYALFGTRLLLSSTKICETSVIDMQPRRGLPPAPAFLPVAPHLSHTAANYAAESNRMSMPSQSALAAQAVTAALSNPYTQTYSSGYHSSHYAQAYMQYGGNSSSWPTTNTGGYTLSSTYVPSIPGPSSVGPTQFPRNGVNANHSGHNRTSQPLNSSSQGSWYQFGNSKCTYNDCTFTGSQKTLETHMMDRHLIYPPGWDNKKKKDWDADPSLKGSVRLILTHQAFPLNVNLQQAYPDPRDDGQP